MRVRCSSGGSLSQFGSACIPTPARTGLRITQHYGNFLETATSDLAFGTVDADKAISVLLEHTATLSETGFAFIQSALLYTTISGQRRVRVCNLGLQVASMAGSVFRYADMDTVVCHLVREGLSSGCHYEDLHVIEIT